MDYINSQAKDNPFFAVQRERQEIIAALRQSSSVITPTQATGSGAGTSMELYRLGLPRREKTHWDYLLDEMVLTTRCPFIVLNLLKISLLGLAGQ